MEGEEEIKKEDIKPGDIVIAHYSSGNSYLGRITNSTGLSIDFSIKAGSIYLDNYSPSNSNYTGAFKYERATEQQRKWLEECIRLGKYIPIEEVNCELNYSLF